MKKVLILVVAVVMLVTPVLSMAAAKDYGAAAVLSSSMGGAGEWYNNDFRGGFPWGECIVGYICCLVRLSSVVDAASGKTGTDMRLDFWSAPSGK